MSLATIKNQLFRLRYGFRGCPKLIDGIPFRLDESLRRFTAVGEEKIQQTLREHLKPRACFVDVGANFGLHSLLACQLVGAQGHVISIEPVPANLRLLRTNLHLNRFASRCSVVPKAMTADGEGDVEMTIEPGLSPAASLSANFKGSKIIVPSGTLDDSLAKSGRSPDLIKIDVEGAEHEVLKGAVETLKKGIPLLIEVHSFALPAFHSSPEKLRDFLAGFGYRENRISEMTSHLGNYYHGIYSTSP